MSVNSLLVIASVLVISRIARATNLHCDITQNFQVELANDEIARISHAELRTEVRDGPFSIHAYPEGNSLEVQTDRVLLRFDGYLTMVNGETYLEPEKISEILSHKLFVAVKRSYPESCEVSLVPEDTDSSRLDKKVLNKIRHWAESCLQSKICSNLGSFEDERYIEERRGTENGTFLRGSSETLTPINRDVGTENCDTSEIQKTLNMFVDIGIGKLVGTMKRENGGAIPLPDVDKKMSFGSGIFESTLHFQLYNGTFRDLTTLRRRSDAVFSNKNFKFSASCEIGLDTVQIGYNNFKVKYGVVHQGSVSGSVDGVALAIKISADYDRIPCAIVVDDLKVTRFGVMNFKLTGLGVPLEWLISTLTDWMSNTLSKNIASALEANVRSFVQSKLSDLDCEKFRA